jgi:hypothetical protein
MKRLVSRLAKYAIAVGLGMTIASTIRAAAVQADMDSPDKRKAIVDTADKLAKVPPVPEKLDLKSDPFNIPGFDLPDQDEKAAKAQAAGTQVEAPLSDSEILDKIAAKIVPSGTIFVGGQPMLMFGKKFVKVGSHFLVTFSGSDYDLVLTSIDRTTFTLALNRAKTTRPIQTDTPPAPTNGK